MTDIGTEAGRRLLVRLLVTFDDGDAYRAPDGELVDLSDAIRDVEAEARRAALDAALDEVEGMEVTSIDHPDVRPKDNPVDVVLRGDVLAILAALRDAEQQETDGG